MISSPAGPAEETKHSQTKSGSRASINSLTLHSSSIDYLFVRFRTKPLPLFISSSIFTFPVPLNYDPDRRSAKKSTFCRDPSQAALTILSSSHNPSFTRVSLHSSLSGSCAHRHITKAPFVGNNRILTTIVLLSFRCNSILISPQLAEVDRQCADDQPCLGTRIGGDEQPPIRYV